MLVMLIITLLLAPSFSAALCVQNDVAKFTIGLRDEIAGVLMPKGGINTADMYKLNCTAGESKLYY